MSISLLKSDDIYTYWETPLACTKQRSRPRFAQAGSRKMCSSPFFIRAQGSMMCFVNARAGYIVIASVSSRAVIAYSNHLN